MKKNNNNNNKNGKTNILKQLKKLREELELEKSVSAKLRKQLDSVCFIANNMATIIKKGFKDKKEDLVPSYNTENKELKAKIVSLQNRVKKLENKIDEYKAHIWSLRR